MSLPVIRPDGAKELTRITDLEMDMEIDEAERERRRAAVAAEIACLALDGGRLAAERLAQLQAYADGQVSLEELRAELIERMRQDK